MVDKYQKDEQDLSGMALSLFEKVKEIKRANPVITRNIDNLEKEIRERLTAIRKEIDKLDKREKELVTVLVINGLHRTADEVLIS
jgi:CHASE3 domain sensor protein